MTKACGGSRTIVQLTNYTNQGGYSQKQRKEAIVRRLRYWSKGGRTILIAPDRLIRKKFRRTAVSQELESPTWLAPRRKAEQRPGPAYIPNIRVPDASSSPDSVSPTRKRQRHRVDTYSTIFRFVQRSAFSVSTRLEDINKRTHNNKIKK